jgi:hypothetical protein
MAQNVYIGQKLTNFTCQDMQLKFTLKKHLVWFTVKNCIKAKSKKVYLYNLKEAYWIGVGMGGGWKWYQGLLLHSKANWHIFVKYQSPSDVL